MIEWRDLYEMAMLRARAKLTSRWLDDEDAIQDAVLELLEQAIEPTPEQLQISIERAWRRNQQRLRRQNNQYASVEDLIDTPELLNMRVAVQRAVSALPKDAQSLTWLSYAMGMTARQISEMITSSRDIINKKLQEAAERLRESLKAWK